jgi:hypothetical protein
MNLKKLSLTSGFVFLIVAVLQVARIAYGWEVTIGGFVIPMWASWIAVVVAGLLSYAWLKSR